MEEPPPLFCEINLPAHDLLNAPAWGAQHDALP
jgi:hypothetical protein